MSVERRERATRGLKLTLSVVVCLPLIRLEDPVCQQARMLKRNRSNPPVREDGPLLGESSVRLGRPEKDKGGWNSADGA